MRSLLLLAVVATTAFAATINDPSSCVSYPCLIFEDEFDFLDLQAWEHEITIGGGGNWEFQGYENNRSISYTHDSTLFIKPQLTSEKYGEAFLSSGRWDIWGAISHNEKCTGNSWYGCERQGTATNLLNPIRSARLRTLPFFSFGFGRLEIRAQMPQGDWIWPAMWLLPALHPYGLWPASGEIDLVEARGNADYGTLGNQYAGTTLHWGVDYLHNNYLLTHSEYDSSSDFFHTWAMDWDESGMTFYHDEVPILVVDPGTSFWDFGDGNSTGYENPWRYNSPMAPFDQDFYIILNVAIGGTNSFFPDEVTHNPPKPWTNSESTAPLSFWNAKADWLPTWEHGEGKISEKAALKVDYVKVWKLADN